uniref:Uncharacterized protein n=1 Tax=Acrobeloides nanus TaxID=290746 RepID=A0A914CTU6_9BILA
MCSPQEYYSICEMGNRYVKEFSATPPPTLNYIVYSEPRPVVSGYPIQTVQLTHIYEPSPLSSAKKLDKKFDKEEPPPIYEPRKGLPKITNIYVLNDANERNYATICENSSESNLDQETPEHMFVSTKL